MRKYYIQKRNKRIKDRAFNVKNIFYIFTYTFTQKYSLNLIITYHLFLITKEIFIYELIDKIFYEK